MNKFSIKFPIIIGLIFLTGFGCNKHKIVLENTDAPINKQKNYATSVEQSSEQFEGSLVDYYKMIQAKKNTKIINATSGYKWIYRNHQEKPWCVFTLELPSVEKKGNINKKIIGLESDILPKDCDYNSMSLENTSINEEIINALKVLMSELEEGVEK